MCRYCEAYRERQPLEMGVFVVDACVVACVVRDVCGLVALLFVVVTGALLIYGTLDMPHYGSATSPAQTHPQLAKRFIEQSADEVGPDNIVTSVLGSYRGYDTLGETVVVFTAGIAVMGLLGLKRRRPEDDVPEHAPGDLPHEPQDNTDRLT